MGPISLRRDDDGAGERAVLDLAGLPAPDRAPESVLIAHVLAQ